MEETTAEKTSVAKRASVRKAAPKSKAVPDPPVQKALPTRQTRSKRSTAEPHLSFSEDEAPVARHAAPTRTRTSRRNVSKATEHSEMEPDRMRSIEENVVEALEMSFEQLRMSDTEAEDNALKDNTGAYFEFHS